MREMPFKSVAEYFSVQPAQVRAMLQELRETISKAAPGAEECISYNMPAFRLHGLLVWYAAHRAHIGFYPRPSGIESFRPELSAYKVSKGAIQFPMDKPLPLELVSDIVKYRVQENLEQAERKAAGKRKNR